MKGRLVAFVLLAGLLAGACEASASPVLVPAIPAPKDLPSIQAEIERMYPGQFSSVAAGARTVSVSFRSTAEGAAKLVKARYGDSVDITVGLFPYPAPPNPPRSCGWQSERVEPGPFKAEVVMPNRIGHGWFSAQVRVTNTGKDPAVLDSGQPVLIYLYQRGGTDPVSTYDGVIAGTGLGPKIAPGGSVTIDALGSTASCDLSLGYDLPDGDYEARGDIQNGVGSPIPGFLSDPFPVTVARSP